MNQQAYRWLIGFLAVPVIYVLSLGPIVALYDKTGWDTRTVEKVYAPVVWLHDHTILQKPLEHYIGFWARR